MPEIKSKTILIIPSNYIWIKNWVGAVFGESIGVRLNPPKIITLSEDNQEIGGKKFNKSPERMKFNFTFESLDSSLFPVNGYNYSMTKIRMSFTRTDKSRQKIFGSYHVVTGKGTRLLGWST